jgi:hypothetical protein
MCSQVGVNGKPMNSKYTVVQWSGRVVDVTEVSEETGRGLEAGSILKSATGRRDTFVMATT